MHEIPELDRAGLRRFGLVTGAIVAVLFGVGLPWLFSASGWPIWPWGVGGVLVAWALLAPASMAGFYRGWMRVGLLLGRVTTPIVLGVVFYVVITPVAVLLKARKRDPLARRFDPAAQSYRVTSARPTPQDLERPF